MLIFPYSIDVSIFFDSKQRYGAAFGVELTMENGCALYLHE